MVVQEVVDKARLVQTVELETHQIHLLHKETMVEMAR
jgi:hypothetical protein